jgi:hypothetical protein
MIRSVTFMPIMVEIKLSLLLQISSNLKLSPLKSIAMNKILPSLLYSDAEMGKSLPSIKMAILHWK